MEAMIEVRDLSKSFTLHTQGGAEIPVFESLNLCVNQGQCVALHGPSGAGKSTLLRSLYANYKPQSGQILIRHNGNITDMVGASPQKILEIRKHTLGYVSQFLRVIPRVPALDIVAEPAVRMGIKEEEAKHRAGEMLTRLRIPKRLWSLAPATFSGGEQQRVNIARGFIAEYPVMLLDEPTASLDPENRKTVIDLILEAKARGAALVGIFHDGDDRRRVADYEFDMQAYHYAA